MHLFLSFLTRFRNARIFIFSAFLLFVYVNQIFPKLEQKIVNRSQQYSVKLLKELHLIANFIHGEPDNQAINWFVQ